MPYARDTRANNINLVSSSLTKTIKRIFPRLCWKTTCSDSKKQMQVPSSGWICFKKQHVTYEASYSTSLTPAMINLSTHFYFMLWLTTYGRKNHPSFNIQFFPRYASSFLAVIPQKQAQVYCTGSDFSHLQKLKTPLSDSQRTDSSTGENPIIQTLVSLIMS